MAVVIRTVDFKDNDRMITFLTREHGLMGAKVRGAKKQTSKLFSASTMFCCGEYTFYEKNGFFGVRSCDIKYTFGHVQDDYDGYAVACFIADAVGKVAQEDDAAPKLFALVVNALWALDKAAATPKSVACYFIQRLLMLEGVYPQLSNCLVCGAAEGLTKMSSEHGGVVCANCEGGKRVQPGVIKALAGMQNVMPSDIAKVAMSGNEEAKLLKLLVDYLEYVLGKPLTTSKYILGEK